MSKGHGGQKGGAKKDQPTPRRRADGDQDERSPRETALDEQDLERAVDEDEHDEREDHDEDDEPVRREDTQAHR
jgi:hypothetical protein